MRENRLGWFGRVMDISDTVRTVYGIERGRKKRKTGEEVVERD